MPAEATVTLPDGTKIPAVTAVLDVIRKPRFIEVHRLAPFKARSVDIDVVMDLMIHDFDYARWISGEMR